MSGEVLGRYRCRICQGIPDEQVKPGPYESDHMTMDCPGQPSDKPSGWRHHGYGRGMADPPIYPTTTLIEEV